MRDAPALSSHLGVELLRQPLGRHRFAAAERGCRRQQVEQRVRDRLPSANLGHLDAIGCRLLSEGSAHVLFESDRELRFARLPCESIRAEPHHDPDRPLHGWWQRRRRERYARCRRLRPPYDACGKHLEGAPPGAADERVVRSVRDSFGERTPRVARVALLADIDAPLAARGAPRGGGRGNGGLVTIRSRSALIVRFNQILLAESEFE